VFSKVGDGLTLTEEPRGFVEDDMPVGCEGAAAFVDDSPNLPNLAAAFSRI
jgi:hypothetical protein